MSAADRAKAIVDAIDHGIVAERPAFKATTLLRCTRCLVRYDIAHEGAVKHVAGPCRCGGTIKIEGWYGRMPPRRTK